MPAEKLAITLSPQAVKFVEAYRREHSLKSRSDVIEAALALLRESEREEEMSEAPEEDDLTGIELGTSGDEADEGMR